MLNRHDFAVEYPFLEIETAFKAVYDSQRPGPTIAFLSEYDALPGIGHGCGHNLLGTVETGAGILLSKVLDQLGGKVIVYGTPAEETDGDKVAFANAGVFTQDQVDVALCTHPSDQFQKSGTSMAMHALEFEFFGQTAHVAAEPFDGKNALDAAVNFYNNVSSLRQQIHPTARVHGVIKAGGEAANVIPDYTRLEYYVRANDFDYLESLTEKVVRCAQSGALAAGCDMKWDYYEVSNKNFITNQTLSACFNHYMNELGITMNEAEEGSNGSTDVGDVSHVVPTINVYYSITNGKKVNGHTREFRDCTLTDYAYQSMKQTIIGLNLTAIDVLTDQSLLAEIKTEFQSNQVSDKKG